jgi:hypothetical protein
VISANRDSFVCTHPFLTVDTLAHTLYLAYLKRAFYGRKNNELVVERFTGSGWQPVGTVLNVNDQTKDAWAFRASLAVSQNGVLYVTWTEHVWGSCPQTYVAHWNGSAWVMDVQNGATLNIDGTHGSSQSPSITFLNDHPVVAWCEHTYGGGSFRKVYVKQFDKAAGVRKVALQTALAPVIQAWPNPFSKKVRITLLSGQGTEVRVFDLRGRLVKNLGPARPSVEWVASGMPCGIYVLKANLNGKTYFQGLSLVN